MQLDGLHLDLSEDQWCLTESKTQCTDVMHKFYFLFLISYFLFLISCFLFLFSYFFFLISYFLFLISCFFFLVFVLYSRHHSYHSSHPEKTWSHDWHSALLCVATPSQIKMFCHKKHGESHMPRTIPPIIIPPKITLCIASHASHLMVTDMSISAISHLSRQHLVVMRKEDR